jgi:hypothetical protein
MSPRLLRFTTLLFLAGPLSAAAQTLPCQGGQEADPCLLNASAQIPVGSYDIRPRSLSIANKQIAITGVGTFTVLAQNITLQPGARVIAPGVPDDPDTPANEGGITNVTLDATGMFTMQSSGNTKSKIDTTGTDVGGDISIQAIGLVDIDGSLVANSTKQFGSGGYIEVWSVAGDVTIGGDPSEGIKTIGDAEGGGGGISIEATEGSITVAAQLVAKGGDCSSSCDVTFDAGGSITTTPQGVIDVNASGIGDGGFVGADAGADLNLAGNIFANGSASDLEGGSGGFLEIDTDGSVTLGRIEMKGDGRDAFSRAEPCS